MFQASLISLCDGQSYKNATICEDADIDNVAPRLFEEWTVCFFSDNKRILCHAWNVKIILLDNQWRYGGIPVDRIILTGNVSYAPAEILQDGVWQQLGIPAVFAGDYGFEGQFVFSCHQGTILTCDTNVSSIITSEVKRQGVTASKQVAAQTVKSAAALPNRTIVRYHKIRRK